MGKLLFGYSWSFSASAKYGECPRQYFYKYLYRDEGFEPDAKRLKVLTWPYAMAGAVVDDAVNLALDDLRRNGAVTTQMSERAPKAFEKLARDSERYTENVRQGLELPSRAKVLHAHYYKYELADSVLQACSVRARSCLHNFETSKVLQTIASHAPERWSALRMPGTDSYPPRFSLPGVGDVWAAFDFHFTSDNDLFIIDWKSGRKSRRAIEKANRQLGVYALYGHHELGFAYSNIFVAPIWLLEGADFEPQPVSEGFAKETSDWIAEDSKEVRSFLREAGSWRGQTMMAGRIEDFPAQPVTQKCFYCAFREFCPEGAQALSRVAETAPSVDLEELDEPD